MPAADQSDDAPVEVKRCAECGARFGIDARFCPFDGAGLAVALWTRSGDPRASVVVDGRYEILEALGEGGMGTVYAVRHVTLDRRLAMKVLRRDLLADAELAARFLREAKATAAIDHPSVVAISDFGAMEDGSPYFVMELLEGETLAARLRARGPLPPASAARLAARIADALAAAHAVNVVHRDLKPENVFLVGARRETAPEEDVRVVDFGAATIVGASKLTRPGIVFGTPAYMSPEQASGEPVDGRADVYSLGVVLFEMLTGRAPFQAETYAEVLTKHLFEAPPRPAPPSGARLGALEDVVMRALAKEPSARYASMAAFAQALEAAAVDGVAAPSIRGGRARAPTMKLSRPAGAHGRERSSGPWSTAATRRRIVVGVVAACAALGLAAIAVSVAAPPREVAPAGVPSPVARGEPQKGPARAEASGERAGEASGERTGEGSAEGAGVARSAVAMPSVSASGAAARGAAALPGTSASDAPARGVVPLPSMSASDAAGRGAVPLNPRHAASAAAPPPATGLPASPRGTRGPLDDFEDPWKR